MVRNKTGQTTKYPQKPQSTWFRYAFEAFQSNKWHNAETFSGEGQWMNRAGWNSASLVLHKKSTGNIAWWWEFAGFVSKEIKVTDGLIRLLCSGLDSRELQYRLWATLLIQPPLFANRWKQLPDNSYSTLISNLTGIWLRKKSRTTTGASNCKMITFLKHMCSIDPPVWEEMWQTLWARVQSPAFIRNRQLGLSSIILSFGKHAQPFLFTSHTQLEVPQPHAEGGGTHRHRIQDRADTVCSKLLIVVDVIDTG